MRVISMLLAGAAISSAFASPVVTVKNGTIRGIHSKEWDQDLFLGIPYALPPTGQLRFRWPQSINESYADELDATRYGDSCYQYNNYYTMSEDCLTLNGIFPHLEREASQLTQAQWFDPSDTRTCLFL